MGWVRCIDDPLGAWSASLERLKVHCSVLVDGQHGAPLAACQDHDQPDDAPEAEREQREDQVQDVVRPSPLHEHRLEVALRFDTRRVLRDVLLEPAGEQLLPLVWRLLPGELHFLALLYRICHFAVTP